MTESPSDDGQESGQLTFEWASPSEQEQVEAITSSQPFEPHAWSVPQRVWDAALRLGGNEPDSLERICAIEEKGYPLSWAAALLQREYDTDGKGFVLDGTRYALWFDENGLRLSPGKSAQGVGAATLSWADAAERIGQLLEQGAYVPQSVLDCAGTHFIFRRT